MCACPFTAESKSTVWPRQNALSQYLTAGSPIGVKMAFRNSLPTTAQCESAPMMHQCTEPFCWRTQDGVTVEWSQFHIHSLFPLSTCKVVAVVLQVQPGRAVEWGGGAVLYKKNTIRRNKRSSQEASNRNAGLVIASLSISDVEELLTLRRTYGECVTGSRGNKKGNDCSR